MLRLTKSEMEIMTVLWEADHPLSRTEILENSKEKSWKDSSIHILLNSMLEKGAVEVAGFEKMGSHYGRTYAPALSESQYAAQQIKSMSSYKKSQGQAMRCIFSALLDDSNVDDETLRDLEKMLRDRRTKNK